MPIPKEISSSIISTITVYIQLGHVWHSDNAENCISTVNKGPTNHGLPQLVLAMYVLNDVNHPTMQLVDFRFPY